MTWRAPALLWLLGLVPFALAMLVIRERHRAAVARLSANSLNANSKSL